MISHAIPATHARWTTRSHRRQIVHARFTAKYNELTALPRAQRRKVQRAAGTTLATIAMSFAIAPMLPAGATPTLTVTTTDDVIDADCVSITAENLDSLGGDGLISLREAICAANQNPGDDTIILPAGTITITLDATPGSDYWGDEDDFNIASNGALTIVGSDDGTVIDGGGIDRVFRVRAGADATFDKLTIQNGNTTSSGGAIDAASSGSTITISNSLIQNNSAGSYGGGVNINNGSIVNTTFVGNTAETYGGAISTFTSGSFETTFDHVTIVGNSAGFEAGGIMGSGSNATVSNSLIAGNGLIDEESFGSDIYGLAVTPINSIVGTTETPLADLVSTTLADNGGPTKTLALLADSPAIDAGAVGSLVDQRGTVRPQGIATDIGAYEVVVDTTNPSAAITSGADAQVVQGSTVALHFECNDDIAVDSCTATVNGVSIADGDPLPTAEVGDLVITVTAIDTAGNQDIATRTIAVIEESNPAPAEETPRQKLTGSYEGASGTEGAVARLYMANFGRQPDAAGFEFWLAQIGPEWSLYRTAAHFTESTEFLAVYGEVGDTEFVELMYQNVLGRGSDAAGKSYWLTRLDNDLTRGDVLFLFSDSIEFRGLTGTS